MPAGSARVAQTAKPAATAALPAHMQRIFGAWRSGLYTIAPVVRRASGFAPCKSGPVQSRRTQADEDAP